MESDPLAAVSRTTSATAWTGDVREDELKTFGGSSHGMAPDHCAASTIAESVLGGLGTKLYKGPISPHPATSLCGDPFSDLVPLRFDPRLARTRHTSAATFQ